MISTVNQFVESFNKGDTTAAAATCAQEAPIFDELPPHEWHGAGACAQWMSDYDADAKKRDITDGLVTLAKPRHADVTGNLAYVVVPADYTYKFVFSLLLISWIHSKQKSHEILMSGVVASGLRTSTWGGAGRSVSPISSPH